MQADRSVLVASFGTVFKVAFDGMGNGRELDPDLMMPSGTQLNIENRIVIKVLNDLLSQCRFFVPVPWR